MIKNKAAFKDQFEKIKPDYKRTIELAVNLLKEKLDTTNIDVSAINHRIKTFESFFEKISRKKYISPFQETEDIAGIRIICYFPSNLKSIENLIKENFNLVHSIDKLNPIDIDKFGYRSHHYIITLKDESIGNPSDGQLNSCKIEIQLRTQLMHAWASIQGKLEYKKEEHSPKQFRRKLVQLSALLELADQQFQDLKEEKERFRSNLEQGKETFEAETEMNIDSFFTFMELHFPHRTFSYRYTKTLFIELKKLKITFKDIIRGIEVTKSKLVQIEEELEGSRNKWTRVITLKTILELTNEKYWQTRPNDFYQTNKGRLIAKWRSTFN